MFHKTSIRLAAIYLGIIMAISLFFSANIYQLSTDELDRGLRRQRQIMVDSPDLRFLPRLMQQVLQEREQEIASAKRRIFTRLTVTNAVILISGGVLSYYFARRSLLPIESALTAQQRFTADASHELRTPLTAMQTEIEVALLSPSFTKETAKKLLHSNLEELEKLTHLTEGLLQLARLENHTLAYKEYAVDELLHVAIAKILPLAEKKEILIEPKIQTTALISADKSSITEAVMTILDNAIKYSAPRSHITVTAGIEHRDVIIRIKDNGIGISAQDLPHIFERFYRSDASRSNSAVNGYGLGLAISKQIIESHHGSISAKSKLNKGSTFIIRLPKAS